MNKFLKLLCLNLVICFWGCDFISNSNTTQAIKINCVGADQLDDQIKKDVINPFSKDESSLYTSNDGGEKLCLLIDFLRKEKDLMPKTDDIETVALNLRKLSETRNLIVNTKIKDLDGLSKLNASHIPTYEFGSGKPVNIHIFLLPTCVKCANFLHHQLKDLIAEVEKNQSDPISLKIYLHPYHVKALIESPAVEVDAKLSAYWQKQDQSNQKVSIDQWYQWYDLIIHPPQEKKKEFLQNPIPFFKEIIGNTDEIDADEQKQLNQRSIDLLTLSDAHQEAPVIWVNQNVWMKYKSYQLTYQRLIDLVKTQKD